MLGPIGVGTIGVGTKKTKFERVPRGVAGVRYCATVLMVIAGNDHLTSPLATPPACL